MGCLGWVGRKGRVGQVKGRKGREPGGVIEYSKEGEGRQVGRRARGPFRVPVAVAVQTTVRGTSAFRGIDRPLWHVAIMSHGDIHSKGHMGSFEGSLGIVSQELLGYNYLLRLGWLLVLRAAAPLS